MGEVKSERSIHSWVIAALVVHAVFMSCKVYFLEQSVADLTLKLTGSAKLMGNEPESLLGVQRVLRSKEKTHDAHPQLPSFLSLPSPPPKAPPLLQSENGNRGIYGGTIDEQHLGGFTERDNNTISPNAWNFMLSELAVKSMVDLGCGRGYSTKYFLDHGTDVLCIEGSHDAIRQSFLPRDRIVQHDFSRGPWWPGRTYDLVWSTEFLEHVGRQYMENYLPVFQRSALVMFSSSGWGGWHHVEVHAPWWWIARMEARGLVYSEELSEVVRSMVSYDINNLAHGGVLRNIMVFINPAVASLPQHKHLIGGHGCYGGTVDNEDGGAVCKGVDALPANFHSLARCMRHRKPGSIESYSRYPWVCKSHPDANEATR